MTTHFLSSLLCALLFLTIIFMIVASSSSSAQPQQQQQQQQADPPRGEHLPKQDAKLFMPHDYDPDEAPPSGFDPSQPPPGFDASSGQFPVKEGSGDKKRKSSPGDGDDRGPPQHQQHHEHEYEQQQQQQQQQQAPLHHDQRQPPRGFKPPRTGPKGAIDEDIHWGPLHGGGAEEEGEGEDEYSGTLGGAGAGKKKKKKKKKKAPEPPKGDAKDEVRIEQVLSIGEEIKNTPRLEAVKALHPYLVVLYHTPSWPWCESCFALENATRMTRLVVDRWASYGPEDPNLAKKMNIKKNKKNKNKNKNNKRNKNKKDMNEQDEDDMTEGADWNSAPYGAAARFAWVDCSASGIHGAFHPCADVPSLPALGIFVNGSDTPLHWYDGYTDLFSVWNFLHTNIPNCSKLQIPDDTKQEERGMTERLKIERHSSSISRLSPKETMEKAKKEPILALLYEQDCRTCKDDTVLLETVAHLNRIRAAASQQQQQQGKKSSKDKTTTKEDEMPLIVRVPVDAQVRSRWLGELDVPQIAFFDVTSPNTPQLYYGSRNVTDLLAFTRFVSRLDVRVPKLALNSKAPKMNPIFSRKTSDFPKDLHITSYDDLKKFLDPTNIANNGQQRLLYVHSTWQRPHSVVAEAGASVHFFYNELERRKGSVKVDFKILVLCNLRFSQQDRERILDMKIFSRQVAPFFIHVKPGTANKDNNKEQQQKNPQGAKIVNMRISQANLIHFGEAEQFLAIPKQRSATTNFTAGHYYVEFNTLAPVISPTPSSTSSGGSASNKNLLLLPFDFYSDREDFYIFVSASNGGVESVIANDRGLAAFDFASREIKKLLDQEEDLTTKRKKKDKQIQHNVSFGVVDISRFPEVISKCSSNVDAEIETSAKSGMPVIVRLTRESKDSASFTAPTLVEFGSALKPYKHVPWEAESSTRLVLDTLLKVNKLPPHPDAESLELTPSNFERVIHEPTTGTLLVFYSSANDPHSETFMPQYQKVAFAFRKDDKVVKIAQLDVEKLDAATKKEYQVTHVPMIRWFPRGTFEKGVGEAFPGTPFPEAMIEFVSEEMELPYFDLEQMKAGGDQAFPSVSYKDFDKKITDEEERNIVLYLSRGRFRNEAKLDVLRRMAKHFDDHKDFQQNFTFARIDAIRYNKKLRKSGLEVDADELPMLVHMPAGINKFQKMTKFPLMEKPFAEVAIARWVAETAEYPFLPDLSFNYTEKELEAERDPPILGIEELDQTNFMDFVGMTGDRVVMFYAPWCKASREFMPTFSKIAQHFEGDDTIEFGRIDVPQNDEIGHQQGIQAFPTIMTYFEGSHGKKKYKGELYPGSPNGETMIEYLTTIRQSSRVQALEAHALARKQLLLNFNTSEFNRRIENGTMHALVEFGVEWCGHCTFLENVLEDIAEAHALNRKRLLVVYVDCSEGGREACNAYNITDNYPKLMLFRRDPIPKGNNKNKHQQLQQNPDGSLPIRGHYLYKETRYFDEIQSFIGNNIPSLQLSQSQINRFEDRRNKEENDFFESLIASKKSGKPVKVAHSKHHKSQMHSGMPQTSKDDSPENRKKRETERQKSQRDEEAEGMKDGTFRPGTFQGKPQFSAWPSTVATLEYDSFLKLVDTHKPLVVINYEEPDDNDEMVAFSMMTESLRPLIDRDMLKLGAIQAAGGDAGISRLVGRHPSVTMFRGLAHPSSVRFDVGKFAGEGDGGSLQNVSHLLSFVQKHLKGAAKHSVEILSKNFEMGTQDPDFTTVVFFYVPWDETSRKVAEMYDEVAQMIGHHDHIICTRVDVSRSQKEYIKLGRRPFPAIYVYDKSAKAKAKEKAWTNDEQGGTPLSVTPRYLTNKNPTRDDLVEFIIAEDPAVKKERDEDTEGSSSLTSSSSSSLSASMMASSGGGEVLEEDDPRNTDEFKQLLEEVSKEEAKEQASQRVRKPGEKSLKRKVPKEEEEEGEEDTIYMPAFAPEELDGTRYAPLTIPTTDHFHITMREYGKNGVLLFFTAEYCSHCPKFEDMYSQAVGPMRNKVVVALMDVTTSKGPMRRCNVASLPALVYVRSGKKPGEEEDDLTVTHFKGQKTVEEFVKFGLANVQGMETPKPGDLPPYPVMKDSVSGTDKSTTTGTSSGGKYNAKLSEATQKDIELVQRSRKTAEELVTNVSTAEEVNDIMFSANQKDSNSGIKGVMIVFIASWCGESCTKVRDISHVVANSMENAMRVVVANFTSRTEMKKLAATYEIRSVPLVALRCTGEDGTLKKLHGSQLGSLIQPGFIRRTSENIAVMFEGFCMKRYSDEELRQLSSLVPEAAVKELKPMEIAALRNDNGILAFIRNAKSCRQQPDCREIQRAFDQFAILQKKHKDNRVKYVLVDSTGDKVLKSALRERGHDLPAIVYLGERTYGSEESDKDGGIKVLVEDMFGYDLTGVPTLELLESFVAQQIAYERKV